MTGLSELLQTNALKQALLHPIQSLGLGAGCSTRKASALSKQMSRLSSTSRRLRLNT